jgi:hypothetical protein
MTAARDRVFDNLYLYVPAEPRRPRAEPTARARLVARLRRLGRLPYPVAWAGRSWIISSTGLTPADGQWGDVRWAELSPEDMEVICARAAQAQKNRATR